MSLTARESAVLAVYADDLARDLLRDRIGHDALVSQLWALAADVGTLRRAGGPEWLCDRASGRIDVALNIVCPSAADMIRTGIEVEDAIAAAEERGKRLRRATGEPW